MSKHHVRDPRQGKLFQGEGLAMTEAIRVLIMQARQAVEFSANSRAMSVLDAALAVERAHEAEIERMETVDQQITDAHEIGALFAAAFARDDLPPRSVKFIQSIEAFWRKFGYVTVRQAEAVRRTVAR